MVIDVRAHHIPIKTIININKIIILPGNLAESPEIMSPLWKF
jgi:hypothetical protein